MKQSKMPADPNRRAKATTDAIVAWFVLVGLAIAWWRHHPMRSFFVPVVSVPVAVMVLGIGTTFLGWAS